MSSEPSYTTGEMKERIEYSLEGISVMLVRLIDARSRAEKPVLSVQQDRSSPLIHAVGRWETSSLPVIFDFKNFVVQNVMRFGEFYHDMAEKIADQIVESVLRGESLLPGFEVIEVYADPGEQGPQSVPGEKVYLRQEGRE